MNAWLTGVVTHAWLSMMTGRFLLCPADDGRVLPSLCIRTDLDYYGVMDNSDLCFLNFPRQGGSR